MPCYRPITAYKHAGLIVFDKQHSAAEVKLPCGGCIGCRLDRSREWAARCMHEASLYENNCFVTLTYSDEFLPPFGSLRKKDFQDFMKRLRARFPEAPIRFYHCGEYGEKLKRPHYHALLFNFDFEDKKLFKMSNGERLFSSDILDRVWSRGHCLVGNVTYKSAAYCARYILKKVGGKLAREKYTTVNPLTGEVVELEPEYATMSRRPGIGRAWYDRFSGDVFPHDYVVVRGKRMKPPRYYDELLRLADPAEYRRLKALRELEQDENWRNSTPRRLKVREKVKSAQIVQLKRGLDNET